MFSLAGVLRALAIVIVVFDAAAIVATGTRAVGAPIPLLATHMDIKGMDDKTCGCCASQAIKSDGGV